MEISVSQIPFRERLWCSVFDACQVTGKGRTNFYKKIASGQIVSKKVGARRLVSVRSLLEQYGEDPAEDAAEAIDASERKAKLRMRG
jgi:hypothetical protein